MITQQALRMALTACLGQVLTPELAMQLEMLAVQGEDRSIDPLDVCQFPESYSARGLSFLYSVERFADIVGELHPLHVAHWQETEGYRHNQALNPDYDAMLASERAGKLVQFTCRNLHDMALVGNLRIYLHRSLHTGGLIATEDTLYLSPVARCGFNAVRFLRFAEFCLKRYGVAEIRVNSKTANNAGALMRRLGYQHVAQQYAKQL